MTVFLKKLARSVEPILGADSLSWLPRDVSTTLAERALTRSVLREELRQRNLERILQIASDETQEEIAEDAVSRDWLMRFFDLAQDVSDERSQQFWARLLVTQIVAADAVFKRTLVQLSNLDHWELDAFIEYCSFAFSFESGWRFMFEESLTRQEIWGYVRGVDYTHHFIHIGLLSPELSCLRASAAKGLKVRYYEKQYELQNTEIGGNGDSSVPDHQFGYRRFTVTGQQLTKAVRAKTYHGYARNLIKALEAERKIVFRLLEEDTE